MTETCPARLVNPGDYIERNTGEVIKVLCSVPERQSAASASAGTWHIEGYSEGRPTSRFFCDSSAPVKIVKRAA